MTLDDFNLPIHRSPMFPGVPHGFGTRHGGVSMTPFATLNVGLSTGDDVERVRVNRARLAAEIGVAWTSVATGHLTHGCEVTVFRQSSPAVELQNGRAGSFRSDGVISNVPGMSLFMAFADCVPLLFFDPSNHVIGMAHAGWRGTAAAIARAVVDQMRGAFSCHPSNIRSVIGPSIGSCCYSIGADVIEAFRGHGSEPVTCRRGGKTYLDLWATNRRQLLEVGLLESHIDELRLCTGCLVNDFFSHRVEQGVTGRFGAIIGLPGASS